MEKLQGPILHPSLHLFEEHLGVGCSSLEEEMVYAEFMNYRFEDPHCTSFPSLEDKMPFLQMLQGVVAYSQPPPLPPPPETDTPSFNLTQQPNFQLLLRLQQEKLINMKSCFANELQSCVTNNNDLKISACEIDERKKGGRSGKKMGHLSKLMSNSDDVLLRQDGGGGGRKKRKRGARPSKNKEQVESQRMTHIAVERNRRRQMNEHLNALRSLMPPSYIQRGDQASIIGGAIDFVKELEQLLQSLQAQKRMRQTEENPHPNVDVSANTSTSTSSSSNFLSNMFMGLSSSSSSSPSSSTLQLRNPENALREEQTLLCAENKSSIGDIEVVVIQNHVNMKIQCQRRPGQLIKAIVGLEDLRLSVLHLNITSFRDFVLYSFNLKIEDDCKLGSADEVATAVHQIFSFINITNL